jgi:hypothetical protein
MMTKKKGRQIEKICSIENFDVRPCACVVGMVMICGFICIKSFWMAPHYLYIFINTDFYLFWVGRVVRRLKSRSFY